MHKLFIVLTVLVVLFQCSAASARGRRKSAGVSSDVAYILSLSWSPSFCATHPSDDQCKLPQRHGLVLHGLWSQSPGCNGVDVRELSSEELKVGAQLFPTRGLMRHEWQKHGGCFANPSEYFATIKRAVFSFAAPNKLFPASGTWKTTETQLVDAVLLSNPHLVRESVQVTCQSGRLRELRICLASNLKSAVCRAETGRKLRCGESVEVPGAAGV